MTSDFVPELSEGDFDRYTKKGLTLIDFFADWCMPCVIMAPVIDDLAEKFEGKIKFGKVNVDENDEVAERFGVRSIPNFVLMKDGKMVEQFVGAMPEDEFERRLKKFV